MKQKAAERKSNFELLRIIAMLIIVAAHYAAHGVMKMTNTAIAYHDYLNGTAGNKLFTCFLIPGGAIGVALFFMISGYFLVNSSKVTLKRIALESIFYSILSIVAYSIYQIRGGYQLSIGIFLRNFFTPITNGNWWFLTAYVFLILMSPVINRFINRLNRRGMIVFILICWWLWYCIPLSFNYIFSQLQRAIFFYILGACLRKLNTERKRNSWLILVGTILFWSLYALCFYTGAENESLLKACAFVENGIAIPGCSYCLFILFQNIDIGVNKKINNVAKTTLGIYLIHESFFGRNFIWDYLVRPNETQYFKTIYPLYAMLTIVALFMVCFCIDFIRLKFIEPRALGWIDKRIDMLKSKYFASVSNDNCPY